MKTANRIWEILYPVLMYYAAISIGIFLAQLLLGNSRESYMLCKIIGSLVAIPVVYQDYKQEELLSGRAVLKTPLSKEWVIQIFFIIGISSCISIACNNIICMSPLVGISTEYETASNALYGSGNFALEILGSALITPFLEEMLHRGVVYSRIRRSMNLWQAVVCSALIFAFLHFNIVQFLYAFLLGMVFAIFMEKTQRLSACVLAHATANGIAVLRTESGFLKNTVDGSSSAWMISIGLLFVGIGSLFIYMNREEK